MLLFRDGYRHQLVFEETVIASAPTDAELRAYMQLSLGLMLAPKVNPALLTVAAGLKVRDIGPEPEENEGSP